MDFTGTQLHRARAIRKHLAEAYPMKTGSWAGVQFVRPIVKLWTRMGLEQRAGQDCAQRSSGDWFDETR